MPELDLTWPRRDFASALAEALQSCDLTLERIVARLAAAGTPVSAATLSYWQTGRSVPTRARSLEAVTVLETVLGLQQAALTGLLTRGADVWKARAVMSDTDIVEAVLASLGLDLEHRFDRLIVWDSCRVVDVVDPSTGRHTYSGNNVIRQTMRVQTDAEARCPYVLFKQGGELPELRALDHVRLGRQLTDASRGMVIGELLLPREYRRGECVSCEYQIDWGCGNVDGDNFTARVLPNEVRLLVLDVRFQDALPGWVSLRYQKHMHAPVELERPLPILHGEVQAVVANAAPGVYSIVWEPRA